MGGGGAAQHNCKLLDPAASGSILRVTENFSE